MAARKDAIKEALREMTAAVEEWVAQGALRAEPARQERATELARNARKLLGSDRPARKRYDPATDGPPSWSPQAQPTDTATSESEFMQQVETYRKHLTDVGVRDPVTGGNTRGISMPPGT